MHHASKRKQAVYAAQQHRCRERGRVMLQTLSDIQHHLERSRHYRLDGQRVVPCTLIEWAACMQRGNRRVAREHIAGVVEVSTAFLGLDHRFMGDGPPLVFETMTFSKAGPWDGYMARYCTYAEAEAGHATVVAMVKAELDGKVKFIGGAP